jgi:hypothetical protein
LRSQRGHGKKANQGQDVDKILGMFGKTKERARKQFSMADSIIFCIADVKGEL